MLAERVREQSVQSGIDLGRDGELLLTSRVSYSS